MLIENNDRQTIALVTVLFNCERHLPLFFESLARQSDRDFIVVIIDNASGDHSMALSRELSDLHHVHCEFIVNELNLGVAVGNNQGIERARRDGIEHIVLINNDIGCGPSLVADIRRLAIGGGHRAWTCLALLGDSDVRWYGGGRLSYWRARGMHYGQRQSAAILAPVAVTYAPTCLMYVHASVFDDVGLMDPQYFVYYDDTDFCRRLMANSVCLTYDPEVNFRHYVGGSSGGELSAFFLRISTRNKFLYIRKHYRAPMLWIVMAIALISKSLQLFDGQRRRATLKGLQDVWALRSLKP